MSLYDDEQDYWTEYFADPEVQAAKAHLTKWGYLPKETYPEIRPGDIEPLTLDDLITFHFELQDFENSFEWQVVQTMAQGGRS